MNTRILPARQADQPITPGTLSCLDDGQWCEQADEANIVGRKEVSVFCLGIRADQHFIDDQAVALGSHCGNGVAHPQHGAPHDRT